MGYVCRHVAVVTLVITLGRAGFGAKMQLTIII